MHQFFNSDMFGVSMDTANWIANGIVALVAVFILFLLYKMFTRPRMASGRRSKNARLAITDAASIDDRRRLVLVRRDDVEHLIMIGGETDMVIEADITLDSAARTVSATASTATPATLSPSSPPALPSPRSEPVMTSPAAPATLVAPAVPAKPASTTSVAAPTVPASSKAPTPATSPSVTVKPTTSTPPASDASSLIGDVRSKPGAFPPAASNSAAPAVTASSTAKPKPSIGDNMDALLTEITTKK